MGSKLAQLVPRLLSILVALAVLLPMAAAEPQPLPVVAQNGRVSRPPHRLRDRQPARVVPLIAYNPSQIRHAYGIDLLTNQGAGQIIGISIAYHAAQLPNDVAVFNQTFGLTPMYGQASMPACTVAAGPHPCLQVVFASGNQPPVDDDWGLEVDLDVQWSHVVAPLADILVSEADNNFDPPLLATIQQLPQLGARTVSMSWGGLEFSGDASYGPYFANAETTYIAASGDGGTGVAWPSAMPQVVSVGGTFLSADSAGNYMGETAWAGSGGGISSVQTEPPYQSSYPGFPATGGQRANPDVAYDADPNSGVSVYDSSHFGTGGWFTVGGTSVGSPLWGGMIALANELRRQQGQSYLTSTNLSVRPEYDAARLTYATNYHDITSGSNGTCGTPFCTSVVGWDGVTGFGSPQAGNLVTWLAGLPPPTPGPTPTPCSPPKAKRCR